ncbi:hypothetical protein V8C34DRAFT_279579 [Trichoderma compactum]
MKRPRKFLSVPLLGPALACPVLPLTVRVQYSSVINASKVPGTRNGLRHRYCYTYSCWYWYLCYRNGVRLVNRRVAGAGPVTSNVCSVTTSMS